MYVPRGPTAFDLAPARIPEIPSLHAWSVSVGYSENPVVIDVEAELPKGEITAIAGPNGCGKSTLLRTFARILTPMVDEVLLGGKPVWEESHKAFARRLAMLVQGAIAPQGVVVEDLVAVGRYPYQRWYSQWGNDDEPAVEEAMEVTGITDMRWRHAETLSGGQRQRVWLAMLLAQQSDVLILDEPTTFLDIAHQVDVLDLVWKMNRYEERTVVLVLHDLGHACRYADHLIVMKDGRVVASGRPEAIVTEDLVRTVFEVDSHIVPDPLTGKPLVLVGR